MDGIDVAILVSIFLLFLGIGGLVIETRTRTAAHEDAFRRNHVSRRRA